MSRTWLDFRKEQLNILYLLQRFSETYLILKRMQRNTHTHAHTHAHTHTHRVYTEITFILAIF